MSLETVRGSTHSWLDNSRVASTVDFPLHFAPYAATTGFGDCNVWAPLPFHYALVERFSRADLVPQLDRLAARATRLPSKDRWPYDAEMLLLHPGAARIRHPAQWAGRRQYPVVDWALLVDRWPRPRLYASVRGGSTAVPHSHLDLLSFHLVAGGKHFIESDTIHEYLDTTFSERRWELFETTPAAKNTLLVNGVGVTRGMLATSVGLVVIDSVRLPYPGRVEARFHTPARIRRGRHRLALTLDGRRLQVAFASNVAADVFLANTAATSPAEGRRVFRWCTLTRAHTQVVFATLFSAAADRATVRLDLSADGVNLTVAVGGCTLDFALGTDLLPRATP